VTRQLNVRNWTRFQPKGHAAHMTDHTTDRILYALYCFSRDTCRIDATELARAVGVTPTLAANALVTLERAGLVDATRARLTMLGLARAAALGASSSGGPAVDLAHATPRVRAAETSTIAAQASAPAPDPAARQVRGEAVDAPSKPSLNSASSTHGAH
jgi:DNA-binding transcriptional ArsR family regulator